jgi:hypothetical protein
VKPDNAVKQQIETPKPVAAPVVNDGLGVIAHAYALVPTLDGRFVAVHLEGVTAQALDRIEPNGRAEPAPAAVQRCVTAMDRRLHRRAWGAK